MDPKDNSGSKKGFKKKKKIPEGITHNEGRHHCMNHLLVILHVYGIE